MLVGEPLGDGPARCLAMSVGDIRRPAVSAGRPGIAARRDDTAAKCRNSKPPRKRLTVTAAVDIHRRPADVTHDRATRVEVLPTTIHYRTEGAQAEFRERATFSEC